jgi:hypothetical protein
MLHVETAKVVGPYQLSVQFSTGETKRINLRPLLKGPVFRPLRDLGFFNLVRVDPECRTVVWPNGADLAPEALYDLPDVGVPGEAARAREVRVSKDALIVELSDKRVVSVPLRWYPRLARGTLRERKHWRLIGRGEGIHWPDLDEDLSVEGIIAGRRSMESPRSFRRWLSSRRSQARKR